jgi:hypothetical protein
MKYFVKKKKKKKRVVTLLDEESASSDEWTKSESEEDLESILEDFEDIEISTFERIDFSLILPRFKNKPNAEVKAASSSNAKFIEIRIHLNNFKDFGIHVFLDTSAGITLGKEEVLPTGEWVTLERPLIMSNVSTEQEVLDKVAFNVTIRIGGVKFILLIIWQFNKMKHMFILGNDFLSQHTIVQDPAGFVMIDDAIARFLQSPKNKKHVFQKISRGESHVNNISIPYVCSLCSNLISEIGKPATLPTEDEIRTLYSTQLSSKIIDECQILCIWTP